MRIKCLASGVTWLVLMHFSPMEALASVSAPTVKNIIIPDCQSGNQLDQSGISKNPSVRSSLYCRTTLLAGKPRRATAECIPEQQQIHPHVVNKPHRLTWLDQGIIRKPHVGSVLPEGESVMQLRLYRAETHAVRGNTSKPGVRKGPKCPSEMTNQ